MGSNEGSRDGSGMNPEVVQLELSGTPVCKQQNLLNTLKANNKINLYNIHVNEYVECNVQTACMFEAGSQQSIEGQYM